MSTLRAIIEGFEADSARRLRRPLRVEVSAVGRLLGLPSNAVRKAVRRGEWPGGAVKGRFVHFEDATLSALLLGRVLELVAGSSTEAVRK